LIKREALYVEGKRLFLYIASNDEGEKIIFLRRKRN
jgi:hypothetical protein